MDLASMVFVTLAALGAVVYLARRNARKKRFAYIHRYAYHRSIRDKFREKWPNLESEQVDLVFDALRQYFHICHIAGRRMVAMPSKIVDDAWHEFILFTRTYKAFCDKAFGRFLHHTPAQAMHSPTSAQEGIKRAWRIACAQEGINPRRPARLPLIFAIDALLEVPDGFRYATDCTWRAEPRAAGAYCGGHIGCASGCTGECGGNDSGGGGDSGDSDGGGCGGD